MSDFDLPDEPDWAFDPPDDSDLFDGHDHGFHDHAIDDHAIDEHALRDHDLFNGHDFGSHDDASHEALTDHDGIDHDGIDHDGIDHDAIDHDGIDHDGIDHDAIDHGDLDGHGADEHDLAHLDGEDEVPGVWRDVDDDAWSIGVPQDLVVELASEFGIELSHDSLIEQAEAFGIHVDESGIATRDVVRLYDGLGIDAVFEHAEIDDLADLLSRGTEIVVVGSSGDTREVVFDMVSVDGSSEYVTLRDRGGLTYELSYDEFEEGWEASTNEVLTLSNRSVVSLVLADELIPSDLGIR